MLDVLSEQDLGDTPSQVDLFYPVKQCVWFDWVFITQL